MLILALRTLILYFLVIIVMRIMGKPQIGELQPFELVVAIILSELAAVAMSDTEIPLLNGIIPILTLLLAQVGLAYWTLKSQRARILVCGQPSILINKGNIVEGELRRLRMSINDLLEQLRVKNYANIAEVDYAILETNGELSVIPKSQNRPVTIKDLSIKGTPLNLPLSLIIDGSLLTTNLDNSDYDEKQLREILLKDNITDYKDIFFAFVDSTGELHWQRKEGT